MRKLLFLFLWVYTSLNAIEIVYEKNSPFIKKEKDKISGIFATSINNAFDSLNIKYTLKEQNFKDQISQIRKNNIKTCAIGWYKDIKLQKLANYSKAIYKDKPYGIITQKRYKIEDNTNIDTIIKQRKYRVLVKQNYPYSEDILNILNQLPKKRIKTNKDYNLATLIAKKKGDYMFISYEKAKSFLQKHKYRSRIKFVPLIGMPEGKYRYLVCSKNVNSSIIKEINKIF